MYWLFTSGTWVPGTGTVFGFSDGGYTPKDWLER